MLLEKNSRLVFIGDSITDAGRERPLGQARPWHPSAITGLGSGYVSIVNALLTARYPGEKISIINNGMSGNNVLDLAARWEQDVLELEPNWLAIMIGINDVWRQFDVPFDRQKGVSIEVYESTYDSLLSHTRPNLQGLLLLSPYVVAPPGDPMRDLMDKYAEVVKRLALKHNAIFVDTQKGFDTLMAEMHPTAIAWDRIHPQMTGHGTIAIAVLRALKAQL